MMTTTRPSDIGEYIRSCKEILEPYIDHFLAGLMVERSDNRLATLYGLFREACGGGKYVRGSLVRLGYEIALDCPARDEVLPAAAAFEIFQTAILSHDDIIDKSPLRRGRDSIWQAAARLQGNHHYGVSQALCLGDVGIALASRLIAGSSFEPDKKVEALKIFLDAQLNTVDGEMLDVLMSHEKDYGDEEGVLRIATLKTAWYTVIGPLRLGAALGGASLSLLDAMKRYGVALGVAFQLRDDVLGIKAAEEETGKSGVSDVAEGKVTLLAHYAVKRATPEQLKRLRRVYGLETATEADRATVREVFESTGAFAAVERRAESLLAEARNAIPDVTRDPDNAALLAQLGDMMFQRKS
ncbi:MAG: polyprenyl synthetase family protein [Synergistaceae bacterium]|jgi:geranylgeranyl diphosphate synthase type I|nr:polyprenyl synthetase family protein [Synergistaceae bacterium]